MIPNPLDRTGSSPHGGSLPPCAAIAPDSSHEQPLERVKSETARSAIRQRRRARLIRFILLESIALTLTVASVCTGLSARFADESFTAVFRYLPVSCAVLAGLLPIIFFGSVGRGRDGRRR